MVHGTGDREAGPPGNPKWWESNSNFFLELKRDCNQRGLDLVHDYFTWTGKNSERARQKAAKELALKIRATSHAYKNVHIVGHSHAGNIIEVALEAYELTAKKNIPVQSVTSVGTPFFKRRMTNFRKGKALWYIFLLVFFNMYLMFSGEYGLAQFLGQVASFGIIAFLYQRSIAGLFKFQRKTAQSKRWLVIFHPNDEAIRALKLAENTASITPKGSFRNILIVFIDIVFMITMSFLVLGVIPSVMRSVHLYEDTTPLALVSILLFLILCFSYILGEFADSFFKKFFDEILFGNIRLMAFGSDGEELLERVQTTPTLFSSKAYKLSHQLQSDMKAAAIKNVGIVLHNNYDVLFNINGSLEISEIVESLNKDHIWRTMIHTSYFDHAEVRRKILDNILEHRVIL